MVTGVAHLLQRHDLAPDRANDDVLGRPIVHHRTGRRLRATHVLSVHRRAGRASIHGLQRGPTSRVREQLEEPRPVPLLTVDRAEPGRAVALLDLPAGREVRGGLRGPAQSRPGSSKGPDAVGNQAD
jgi:hypothetical protein